MEILEEHGPSSNLPFPGVYVGKFTKHGEQLSCRDVGILSKTLEDPQARRDTVLDAYGTNLLQTPNPLSAVMAEGARELGRTSRKSLALAGLDVRNIDQDPLWDEPVPFTAAYVGYGNTPEDRLKHHRLWYKLTKPSSLNHLIAALASMGDG